jgi:hypothetical protein
LDYLRIELDHLRMGLDHLRSSSRRVSVALNQPRILAGHACGFAAAHGGKPLAFRRITYLV